jgi:choline dehydrogenase-like flavoprotein
MHLNSAILGFSPFEDHDVLRKTAVLYNDRFPHSSLQCLGWIDREVLATQAPKALPGFLDRFLGKRAIGFWATTEDGSSPQNRIISGGPGGQPVMDYSLDRIERSKQEHAALMDAWIDRLLHAGLVGFDKYMGLGGTAHALGSMVTGNDPRTSVVDPHGKVHGMDGLYVGDGSPLPRASRVNPSLTIYAWGLRLGDQLAGST